MKKSELIYLENQTVGIDSVNKRYDWYIPTGKWYIDDTNTIRQSVTDVLDYWQRRTGYNEIIFSRPLLENTILLPDWEGNNVEKLADEYLDRLMNEPNSIGETKSNMLLKRNGYLDRLKFQSAQKKFSLEDILEMFDGYMNEEKSLFEKMSFKEYIFSLKKKPIAIEYDGIKDNEIINFKYIY